MQIKLLTIFLLLFTSQVFAWTEGEKKLYYSGCAQYETNWTYKEQHGYCACHTELMVKRFTIDQVRKMTLNGTLSENKYFKQYVNHCVKKHINY